jgi:sterol desaturase/sphingolipid hydroxylase (fatty acid hydroxylase superfamily)
VTTAALRGGLGTLADYAIFPAFFACAIAATEFCFALEVPIYLVAAAVTAPLAVAAAILERMRPERGDWRRLDQPFAVDAAHFLLPYQIGYALGIGAAGAVGDGMRAAGWMPAWPASWPLPLQIVFGLFLAEVLSYWQHRLVHRVPWLWRFHALHHSGERLNLLRAGRFHLVDIGLAAFLVILPLAALGAPPAILAWVTALSGVFGVLEHANLRIRTPAWLGWLICTPAVHRHHHSRTLRESDGNFSTLLMLMDVLFGTYQRPRPDGPPAVGIEVDPVTRGFWNQVMSPFRRPRRPGRPLQPRRPRAPRASSRSG